MTKENIRTLSLGIIAVVVLIFVGYTIASKEINQQVQINQIVSYLNSQIPQKASAPISEPITK